MKKYTVTVMGEYDEFEVLATNSKDEAIATARAESEVGSKVEIRMYEDERHLDYDTIPFERRYYIVDCISGCRDGVPFLTDLTEAVIKRDELNEERKANGGSDEFWIIVDENGDEVTAH